MSREVDSRDNTVTYEILTHLFNEVSTLLQFVVGSGRYLDLEGNEQFGTFLLLGHDDYTNETGVDGVNLGPASFPGYPDGRKIGYYMTADSATQLGPMQCKPWFNASIFMEINKRDTSCRAFLKMDVRYKPQAVTFSVKKVSEESAQHCVISCFVVSSCPGVKNFTMRIFDPSEQLDHIVADSDDDNFVSMKIPMHNCKWLAENRNFKVQCAATNEYGTTSMYKYLSDVRELG